MNKFEKFFLIFDDVNAEGRNLKKIGDTGLFIADNLLIP